MLKFISQSNLFLFTIIILTAILLSVIINQFLITDNVFYNSFSEQLTFSKIDEFIKQTKEWEWLSYIILSTIYLFKFSLTSFCILIGLFFFNHKVSFFNIFKVIMLAEIPLVFIPLIKLFWFLFIQTQYTFNDLQYFYPLSALQLFEIKTLATWQIYPLQLLNVFELVYWVLLAYWLKRLLNISLTKGMEVVVASYGTGLLLWVVFITFLSLNAT